MKQPSEPDESWDSLRDKIIGLGEGSIRKSYYPELQQRLAELERFRALLDQSNDAIFLIQLPTHLITDLNESACQQLGYAREELLNQPIDQLGSSELASWLGARPTPLAGAHAERETFEAVLRRRTGETLPVEVTARRVAFQGADYAVVVARDITERQRAEREIVKLNRLYAVLSDINQVIVRTRDQQQLFNAACHIAVATGQFRLVGVGRVDNQTHAAQLIAISGDRAELLESLLSSEPTTSVWQSGRNFLSNDLEHDLVPGQWREAAVRQGCRSLVILPLIVFDRVWGVIQFYAAEPAFFDDQELRLLAELAADLAYAVESLQREEQRRQAEEALRQTQKIESIGILAGGIAHDFNNLLVAMLGQTSLALEQLPAESIARSHIEKAVGAARRAADLTRQLLAYSGRGQFQIAPLNLNTLIQENLHLFEVAVPKNVRLVSELMESLPAIDGDVGQLQQVVMNLIINATEAIGRNPGTVSITTNLYTVTPADDD
ncbi:MAG: PAS domain S-box protein, partial [Chloroflexi bacterium]|nr:PAS domain S-box protein [Chloroflexota bacterium]